MLRNISWTAVSAGIDPMLEVLDPLVFNSSIGVLLLVRNGRINTPLWLALGSEPIGRSQRNSSQRI